MNNTLVILLCKKQKKYVKSLQDYLQNFVETIVCEENLSIPKNYVGLNKTHIIDNMASIISINKN